VPRAHDSKGARNSKGLAYVIKLTALTTEVLNKLVSVNGSASHFASQHGSALLLGYLSLKLSAWKLFNIEL